MEKINLIISNKWVRPMYLLMAVLGASYLIFFYQSLHIWQILIYLIIFLNFIFLAIAQRVKITRENDVIGIVWFNKIKKITLNIENIKKVEFLKYNLKIETTTKIYKLNYFNISKKNKAQLIDFFNNLKLEL